MLNEEGQFQLHLSTKVMQTIYLNTSLKLAKESMWKESIVKKLNANINSYDQFFENAGETRTTMDCLRWRKEGLRSKESGTNEKTFISYQRISVHLCVQVNQMKTVLGSSENSTRFLTSTQVNLNGMELNSIAASSSYNIRRHFFSKTIKLQV